MTKAEYLQRGESLDYTNATEDTIPDGAVVTIGSRIGVTGCPIPPARPGASTLSAFSRSQRAAPPPLRWGRPSILTAPA